MTFDTWIYDLALALSDRDGNGTRKDGERILARHCRMTGTRGVEKWLSGERQPSSPFVIDVLNELAREVGQKEWK